MLRAPFASSRCFSTLALLGLTAAVFVPDPAEACSPPPEVVATLGASEIPVDGIVLFRLGNRHTIDDLIVTQGEDEVAGTFAVFDQKTNLYTWTPAADLSVGAEYSIRPSEDFDGNYFVAGEFTAVASSPDAPEPATHLTTVTLGKDQILCSSSSWDDIGSCASPPSLYDGRYFEPRLELLVEGPNRSQFVYDVEWSSGGEPTVTAGVFGNTLMHTFVGAPASVCYSLVAHPIDGGAEIDLGGKCISTAELDLEPTDEDVGDRKTYFKYCLVPPTSSAGASLTREWCDTFRAQIDAGNCSSLPSEPCEAALELCGDAEGDDDDATNGDDLSGNEGPADEGGGGCSVATARVNSTPGALALFGAVAVSFGLRRRRAVAPTPR